MISVYCILKLNNFIMYTQINTFVIFVIWLSSLSQQNKMDLSQKILYLNVLLFLTSSFYNTYMAFLGST